jgi:uncharacterized damage-inducible protein DinB
MVTHLDDLYDRFHELHNDLIQSIDGLSPEALDWVPGGEMNSINVLIVHLIGAERYWIGVAVDVPPERDRDKEFKAYGLNLDGLKARLSEVDEYTHHELMHLSIKDLSNVHQSPHNQKTVTAGWAILHALEHTAIHAGHVQLTRQMWEQRNIKYSPTPSI